MSTEVYIYKASLYCKPCGEHLCSMLEKPPSSDESTWDSDNYPKGPYPEGGGEADYLQHCDNCGMALGNAVTGSAS